MNIKKAIGIAKVLQSASPASLAALAPYASVRRFEQKAHLFLDKNEARHIYFLVEGVAAIYVLNSKQDRRVIFICGAGEMLSGEFLDGKPASGYCELLTDSWVLIFDRQKFLYVCSQDFALSKAVMDALSLIIRRLYRQIKNTSNSIRGDRKIAAKLWKLSKDYGTPCDRGIRIDFDLSVTFLAELLGSKRETVSRQLKLLKDSGLVITDKNRIIIPNCDELKKYYYEA